MPTKDQWAAEQEVRRWLTGPAIERWEIKNEPSMPAFVRNEIARADAIPGYRTPDEMITYGMANDPAWASQPIQAPDRQTVNEAVKKAVMSTPKAQKMIQSILKSLTGSPASGGGFGNPATQEGAEPTFWGRPSSNPGAAYGIMPGHTMGYPTEVVEGYPSGKVPFSNMKSVKDYDPDLANAIEKVVVGAMFGFMPLPAKIAGKAALKASKRAKEAREMLTGANEVMAQQTFADQYAADNQGATGGSYPDFVSGTMPDLYGQYGSLPEVYPGAQSGIDMITISPYGVDTYGVFSGVTDTIPYSDMPAGKITETDLPY